MNELKATTGETFPLKSSLFWDDNGTIDSTWGYLARNVDDAKRQRMVGWQASKEMNTMVFLTYNRDQNCLVNPFVQTYGPDVDWAEAAKWIERFRPGLFGANLIPCLFCDDDPDTARNVAFHDYYIPAACIALGPYSRAICVGLEMNEQFSIAAMEHIIALCHTYTDKPVVVHMQWNMTDPLPAGLDGLIYEHPWHPKDGDLHSADEVASIGAQVIARAGIPVGFNEHNLTPWSPRGREQTRALAKLPCFLVGGPM